MGNYCIYRHIRLDTNKVFYIGIGNVKRALDKRQRSKYWNRIINKTEYEIQILKSDLVWDDACELERMLISYYGRKDNNTGILCNMTDGGEGGHGVIVSIDTKNKMKKAKLNKISNSSKKIIDTVTMQIFNSIKEASDYLMINRTTLNAMLKGQNPNKTTFKYLEHGN